MAALAVEPQATRWNTRALSSGYLAQVYGFTDTDGSNPPRGVPCRKSNGPVRRPSLVRTRARALRRYANVGSSRTPPERCRTADGPDR